MSRFFIFILLSTVGCKRPAAQETNANTNTSTINVTGVVLQTEAYCGGAAPNQRILDELQTPKPLPGKNIYVKAGKANNPEAEVVAEVIADERGEFTLSLAPGWYVLVDESKKDRASYNYMLSNFAAATDKYTAVDRKCLDGWVKNAELVFEAKEGANEAIEVTFHKPCTWNSFPCVRFTGERPR